MTSAIGLGSHRGPSTRLASRGRRLSSITNALAAVLADLGGKIETGTRIEAASQLPPADVVMFDLAPVAVADILGDRLPGRVQRAYRRFRQGPGAFKVDFAVESGVPWTSLAARRAGTVHVVGTFTELASSERDIHAGRMPERPFVLVGQQYLADPQRSVGNVHPVWTYAHVPNGYSGDATAAIVAQIERFAPGFRERIVGQTVRTTKQMSLYNPNYVGGDIMTGSKDIRQLAFGPRITLSPYRIGLHGRYICSATTPRDRVRTECAAPTQPRLRSMSSTDAEVETEIMTNILETEPLPRRNRRRPSWPAASHSSPAAPVTSAQRSRAASPIKAPR
jgi:phytoene dehydrogenase-like protein